MKKKVGFIVVSTIILLVAVILFLMFKSSNNPSNRIKINGIESFTLPEKKSEDHYFLFYPADGRVSQEFTLVKEVTNTGKVIQEYEVKDKNFRRAMIHQKPNDSKKLYISLFGEAVVQNWFYTFDLVDKSFKRVSLNYFEHDVGVNHLMHYGPDVLFNTIVSHKTGDQVLNQETGEFKMSIANYTKEKTYETEWGYEPDWSPILQFNNNLIYAGSGQVNDEGIAENTFVAIIDATDETMTPINFDRKGVEFSPLYASEEKAFILGSTGELFILNKDLIFQTHEPFKDLEKQDLYYSYDGSIMLNEELAMHAVYNVTNGTTILGLLTLDENPKFTVLEKDYLDENKVYKLLYQDLNENKIYLIEGDSNEDDGTLIVIDNQSFDLIDKLPIDYHYLLDMVIGN